MNPVTLSTSFKGLNRLSAPHLLDEAESPAVIDALTNDQQGLLQARPGRKRIYTAGNTIIGVVPYRFSFVFGRVVADASGNWTPVDSPATSLNPGTFSGTVSTLNSASCSGGTFTTTGNTLTFANGLLTSVV